MNFDLHRMIESKRALRQRLAALPIAEKLRTLDAMRERALAIRGPAAARAAESTVVREDPPDLGPGERQLK